MMMMMMMTMMMMMIMMIIITITIITTATGTHLRNPPCKHRKCRRRRLDHKHSAGAQTFMEICN